MDKLNRVNQCLEMYLRCVIHGSPNSGRTGYHWLNCGTTHVFTLLLAVLLSKLYILMSLTWIWLQQYFHTHHHPVTKLIQDREWHIQALKQHLADAQNMVKFHVDKKRTDLEFQVEQVSVQTICSYFNCRQNIPC